MNTKLLSFIGQNVLKNLQFLNCFHLMGYKSEYQLERENYFKMIFKKYLFIKNKGKNKIN